MAKRPNSAGPANGARLVLAAVGILATAFAAWLALSEHEQNALGRELQQLGREVAALPSDRGPRWLREALTEIKGSLGGLAAEVGGLSVDLARLDERLNQHLEECKRWHASRSQPP